MKDISRRSLILVGGVFLLACLFAVTGSGSASVGGSPQPAVKGNSGLGWSFGGSGEKRVEVLQPRRGPIAATIQGAGIVQAGSEVGIGAAFEGRVSFLNKDEGDAVVKGELVFRLDPQAKQEAVDEADIDLLRKTTTLSDTKVELVEAERKREESDDEPSEMTEARLRERQSSLQADRAQAQLEAADAKLNRAKLLLRQGVGRQTEVEAAQSEQRVSAFSLKIAKEELALARETLVFRTKTWNDVSRPEAVKTLTLAKSGHARARADVKAAKIALARAKRDLKRTEIRSPINGIVTARQVNSGDEVSRATGDVAHYILSDLSHMLVYTDVDEGDVIRVSRGQSAKVTVNALGEDQILTGLVYDVGYRARTKAGEEVPFFRVRIQLVPGQEGHDKLRPGMTATVQIETARETDALKVPIQAVVQRERSELPDDLESVIPAELREGLSKAILAKDYKKALVDVVYVAKDGAVQVRVVKLGLQDENEVQVLAGLEDDVDVVVGPFRVLDKLKQGTKVRTAEATDVVLPAQDVAAVDSGS